MKPFVTMMLASLALGAATSAHAAPQVTSVLSTNSGPVRGIEQGAMNAYLGIPYAAPPVGPLRWMPPQKPASWTAALDASKFGSSCAQNADLGVFAQAGGTEDCLYLNVYVGKQAAQSKEKLPVLFWIHGGSLWVGAGSDYDPRKLAVDGKAIVVTINYRMGMFGFFAHPAIDREGHMFANYGLMDQQFAMDWVQQNISQFGGDPGNVTIFGESSGGTSVLSQIAAPSSAGKFQHAIAMSGATVVQKHPAFGSTRPLDAAQDVGTAFAKAAGCEGDASAECLSKLTTGQILAIQTPYLINQTIIDGTFMPIAPAEAFKTGKFNHVTLLNGNVRDEGTVFVGLPENATGVAMTADAYKTTIESFYGQPLAQQVLQQYPASNYNSPSEAFGAANTASQFACPARMVNQWVSKTIPTYAYEFADRTAPSYLEPTTYPLGAAHTYELPYIFPGFHGAADKTVSLNPLQEKLSDEMVQLWAQAGKVASRDGKWERYDNDKDNYLSLTLPKARMMSQPFASLHNCKFWDQTGLY
jgi:para-nitrobenzyl esterase